MDHSFVADYLHRAQEKENQTPIELSDSDDSVEFVSTAMASPATKRMAKLSDVYQRLSSLEKQNRSLLRQNRNLQGEVKVLKEAVPCDQFQTNAAQIMDVITLNDSNEPSTSVANQPSTSAANQTNASVEANSISFGCSIDENWAEEMLKDMIASGEINDIAETILNDLK